MTRTNPAKTTDLLNELSESAGCYYLSDLHDRSNAAAVSAAADAVPHDRYTPAEWREAARYILQTGDVAGDTVEAVIGLLKARIGTAK